MTDADTADDRGLCRAIDPSGRFMCDLTAGHAGDHSGVELLTVTLDEEF